MGNKPSVFAVALLLGSILPMRLGAQGCSQCRDNVSQTNPAVQASYREAILVMLGAAALLTTTAVVVIRRMR